ncbi:MAG: ABC transporter permease [Lachnospiraceae bacterium]|nr:ABC transporter permease [Lachnospiraceae bacterium]
MKKKNSHPLARILADRKLSAFTIPALSILLSLIVASLLLLALGKNPLQAYGALLQGCGFLPKAKYGAGKGMLADFFTFLNLLAPMIIAALAFIIASRCGLFNIGISGQMLAGAWMAYLIVGYSGAGAWIAKPLVILIGAVTGGLFGMLVGFLKYRFNIHEVVATIMLNHIIRYLVGFHINGWHADPMTRNAAPISTASRLSWTGVMISGQKCSIPLGIVLAVIAAFAVKFLFEKTVFGFELRAVGMNSTCARYTGIRVGRNVVYAMMLSGMLAGLAGVCFYTGYTNTIVPKTLAGMGYDSIAVAILGNSSPVGAIFASFLITIFQNGTNYMSSSIGVASEIASLITGIMLLFSACGGYIREKAAEIVERSEDDLKYAAEHQGKEADHE